MATQKISRTAFDKLQAEHHDLTTRGRIEVAEKIERAREEGDLRENAGYHAAKDEQGQMEGRIRQLEYLLENAEVVDGQKMFTVVYDGDSDDDAENFVIGNLEEEYDDASVISASSPLGAALEHAAEGDEVTYEAPNGALTIKILKITDV